MIRSVLTQTGEVAHGLFIGLLIQVFGFGAIICLRTFEIAFWSGHFSLDLAKVFGMTLALFMIPFFRMFWKNGASIGFLIGLVFTSLGVLLFNIKVLVDIGL